MAVGIVVLDVKLSASERKAMERITGGRVLPDARLEVKVKVEVKGKGD
jgi:hypothetical protein